MLSANIIIRRRENDHGSVQETSPVHGDRGDGCSGGEETKHRKNGKKTERRNVDVYPGFP